MQKKTYFGKMTKKTTKSETIDTLKSMRDKDKGFALFLIAALVDCANDLDRRLSELTRLIQKEKRAKDRLR